MSTTIQRPIRYGAYAALSLLFGLGVQAQPPANDALEVTIRL